MSRRTRRAVTAAAGAAAPDQSCSITLTAPGDASVSGADPMTIDGQTATCPAGTLHAAESPAHAFPSGTNAVVMEVHYDPADWAGANVSSNRITLGDILSASSEIYLAPGSAAGQGTNAVALLALIQGGDKFLYMLLRDGTVHGSLNVSGLADWKAYLAANVTGAKATFVTDSAQFVCDISALTGAGYTPVSVCGEAI